MRWWCGLFGLCGRTGAGFHDDPADHPHDRGDDGLVPNGYREAAFALGIPHWRIVLNIVLKTAGKGIITGILLAAARVAGETAPLLFTAFGNSFWSHNLSEPIEALPLQIFTYAISPYDDWHRQAWAGALVLIMFVLALNIGVRVMTRGRDAPSGEMRCA